MGTAVSQISTASVGESGSRLGFAVCVAGVSGIGKSTLIRAHVGDGLGPDRQLTGSSIVKAIIAPATVQDFDRWPEVERVAVRDEAIRRLVAIRDDTEGVLLVDGHFTLRNRHTRQIESVFTAEDRRFYGALVLLEASAPEILTWRQRDERDRGFTTVELLQQELDAERHEAEVVAKMMGVPLVRISTTDPAVRLTRLRAFLNLHSPLEATR
jgi:adenylate kinase